METTNSRAVVLIPAYKPDERLIALVEALRGHALDVMVVDDGGGETYAPIFEQCESLGAKIAAHAVNLGKGRALKTGINAALLEWPDLTGIITADADGQHTVADILRLTGELATSDGHTLVLGSRAFTGDVPFKSRWGNRITRFVYALASGMHVRDTQTGLRALPRCALEDMMRVDGERYEYEMNVLLKLRDMHLNVREMTIETIYLDGNASSHFNPVRDAMRIYMVIFKYLFSAIFSFLVDYGLYLLLMSKHTFGPLKFSFSPLLSYALARLVSSQVNYNLNRHAVFSGRGGRHAMAKYYALAAVQGLIGAGLVELLPRLLPIPAQIVKIPVDIVLFAVSYLIQRDYVFDR